MNRPSDQNEQPVNPETGKGNNQRVINIVIGGFLIVFLLSMLGEAIAAVIGLFTGYLFLPGRGRGIELYGLPARITSAGVLLFFAVVVVLLVRGFKRKRRPKILGERDHQ